MIYMPICRSLQAQHIPLLKGLGQVKLPVKQLGLSKVFFYIL